MIDRRIFLSGALGALLMHSRASADEATDKFTALEKAIGGRLGVCILDTGNGKKLSHRGDERFALLSTFKALAAGCVLARVDRGEERLDRRVKYTQADVLSYAPVAKLHDDGRDLRCRHRCERQHGGQSSTRQLRRAGGADQMAALDRR
jgi:beta-lactamase class A